MSCSKTLAGKKVALVPGHEPGGGAENEREWNTALAHDMAEMLEELGAEVYIHAHMIRSYGARQAAMRAGVKKHLPGADCVIELHYNGVDYPEAHGHEFHYRGYKALAESFRDSFQKEFPWSKARRDNGILSNRNGRGAGFLKAAPAAACLVEPFFYSNPEEKQKIFRNPAALARCYVEAISNFLR